MLNLIARDRTRFLLEHQALLLVYFFAHCLAKFGLGRKDIVANLNFFMYVPITAEGGMAIVDGLSKAGDYVDLRAEMDVLVALSNCPQMNNPANDYNPTPIRISVRTQESA